MKRQSKIARLIEQFVNEAEDISIKSQNVAKMEMIIKVADRCKKAYEHYGKKFTNDTELTLSKFLDDALEKLNKLDNSIEFDLRGVTGVAPSSPPPSDAVAPEQPREPQRPQMARPEQPNRDSQ